MTTRIALLRAVNVGRRTVKMSRLIELFDDLGFTDVWTHINSGNVVFDGTGARAALEATIQEAVEGSTASSAPPSSGPHTSSGRSSRPIRSTSVTATPTS